ncbi:MAG: hypothetical protein JWM57_3050 [Phycisphaerales bacterium]|nr:hypothetical protein [Phycisphaerales bacterium]
MRRYVVLGSLLLVVFNSIASAETPAATSFKVPKHAPLLLNVPAGWKKLPPEVPNPPDAPGISFRLVSIEPAGPNSVSFFFTATKDKSDDDALKKIATASSMEFVGGSVEKAVNLKPIDGDQTHGFYATFTDASADPGRYACVTTFIVRAGDGQIFGNIMHPKNSVNQKAALDMIRTAAFGAATTQPASTQPVTVRMTSPDHKWVLLFDLPGAEEADTRFSPNGKAAQLSTGSESGIVCTAFIEPAENAGDARAVRKFYWDREQKAPIRYSNVRMSGDANLAVLRFSTFGVNPNVHGYLVHEGTWIDIHLSRPNGTNADSQTMDAAVKSARFESADTK